MGLCHIYQYLFGNESVLEIKLMDLFKLDFVPFFQHTFR